MKINISASLAIIFGIEQVICAVNDNKTKMIPDKWQIEDSYAWIVLNSNHAKTKGKICTISVSHTTYNTSVQVMMKEISGTEKLVHKDCKTSIRYKAIDHIFEMFIKKIDESSKALLKTYLYQLSDVYLAETTPLNFEETLAATFRILTSYAKSSKISDDLSNTIVEMFEKNMNNYYLKPNDYSVPKHNCPEVVRPFIQAMIGLRKGQTTEYQALGTLNSFCEMSSNTSSDIVAAIGRLFKGQDYTDNNAFQKIIANIKNSTGLMIE